MVVVTDIAHEHTDLAVVDFSSVAAPLPFDTYRMRATFGETTGIEGTDAIRLTQSLGHLTPQHLDQRAMRPWGGANKFLQDLSLDVDSRRDVLGILSGQVGQQSLEVEMQVALDGLSLKGVWKGHDELAQTVDHRVEHVGGHDTIAH
jgi:hypothetical protein